MKPETRGAIVTAGSGTLLAVVLLWVGLIGDRVFLGLVGIVVVASLAVATLPRLHVLNLWLASFQLDKVEKQIEKAEAKIAQMYGSIDHIKRPQFILDDQKMQDLGLETNAIPAITAVMRYTAGVVTRERARLARIFVRPKTPAEIAEAVVDASLDDNVFKWNGPEVTLDVPPKSLTQRNSEKTAKESSEEKDG